jgi:hypothetical protein
MLVEGAASLVTIRFGLITFLLGGAVLSPAFRGTLCGLVAFSAFAGHPQIDDLSHC